MGALSVVTGSSEETERVQSQVNFPALRMDAQ